MPAPLLSLVLLAAASVSGTAPDPDPVTMPQSTQPTSPDSVVALGEDNATRMTVPVSVDGKGPYAFVIDTGAERTLISSELAEKLNLDPAGSTLVHSMSGISRIDTVHIPLLDVSSASVRNIQAPSIGKANLGAIGMLGVDSLQNQKVLIDFRTGTMRVAPSLRRERAAHDPNEIVVTAHSMQGRLVLVDASIDGEKIWVVVDTGTQVSVGNEALRRKVRGWRTPGHFRPIELMSVTGGRTTALFTQIRGVRIGGATLQNLPVAFADVLPFKTLGLQNKPALLLGMDGLKLFERVSVDFANRKVRLVMREGADLELPTHLAERTIGQIQM